jgi:hypothetical protein
MSVPSRRAFFALSARGLCALQFSGSALAAFDAEAAVLARPPLDVINGLNLQAFLNGGTALGLAGLMSMEPVQSECAQYERASLFLFPFKLKETNGDAPAFLPGSDAVKRVIPTTAMDPLGLPPDEFFCHYVLKAPRQSFIGFELGGPLSRERANRPWHSNLKIGDAILGATWTSSNLNDPWFAGSRWIPDNGSGRDWRARIIRGLRRAATAVS